MSKKDLLKRAFTEDTQASNRTAKPKEATPEFTPLEPMSLSTKRRAVASVEDESRPAIKPQAIKRAYNTAKLPKAKHGVINTKRYSFEITPELHQQMIQVLAEYTANTGHKVSASEFIRKAIAREIREFKR